MASGVAFIADEPTNQASAETPLAIAVQQQFNEASGKFGERDFP